MKAIVNKLIKNLEKNGIKVKLIKSKFIKVNNLRCSGYFDDSNKILKVAAGNTIDKWFPIFIHEYCHFEQSCENLPVWKNSEIDGMGTLDIVIDYFQGNIKLTKSQLKDYLHRSAMLELDCEKRVLKKIKEYNLPIDKEAFIKGANSYIAFYYAMEKLKSWYKLPPYKFKEILDKTPGTFKNVDHKALAKKLLKLYKKHCI